MKTLGISACYRDAAACLVVNGDIISAAQEERFKELTNCLVIVNTSFNVRGEPVVCSPEDPFRCFMGTELDVLVVGNCLLEKIAQSQILAADYKVRYELD